jgi:hypothetical protein
MCLMRFPSNLVYHNARCRRNYWLATVRLGLVGHEHALRGIGGWYKQVATLDEELTWQRQLDATY